MSEPRIVDLVFARTDSQGWRRGAVAVAASGLVGTLTAIVLGRAPTCECGVSRVSRWKEHWVEVAPRTPPPPTATPTSPPVNVRPENATGPRPLAAPQAPPTFAQAATIVAREPAANEPLDLTGEAFVTGSGAVYSGGFTTTTGTSSAAVRAVPAPAASGARPAPQATTKGPDRSRPVGLPDPSWTCPWPAGAESEALDEQSAFVQVVVRKDGSVQSATVLVDPGLGFGEAAKRCALGARFSAALNAQGEPIQSVSPPIRVRFYR